jgi:hypothetical protein
MKLLAKYSVTCKFLEIKLEFLEIETKNKIVSEQKRQINAQISFLEK